MVGVAGKSQACQNCKNRRVKCDLRRPHCLRCQKARLQCTGYGKSIIFVNQTPTDQSETAVTVLSELRRNEDVKRLSPNLQYDYQLNWLLSNVSSSTVEPLEYRRKAFELLRKIYLPEPQNLVTRPLLGQYTFSWLEAVCRLTRQSPSLSYSLLAFCMSQVYLTRLGNVSLEQALRFYSLAIEYLRAELEDPEAKYLEETISSILILSTCELFISPADHGWRAHVKGISEILRTHPPIISPTWEYVSFRVRVISVMESLGKRQALAISPTEWKQMTPLNSTAERDALRDLVEIISEVPILMEMTDSILHGEPNETNRLRAAITLRGFLSQVKRIYELLEAVRASSSGPPYWAIPSTVHNPSDDATGTKLFPFSLEFESLHCGMTFVLGWGPLVSIFSCMIRLYCKLRADSSATLPLEELLRQPYSDPSAATTDSLPWDSNGLTLAALEAEADRVARLVCQSVAFLYRTDMGVLGPQATTFAQSAVKRFFQEHAGYERELAWCFQIKNMKGPGFRSGLELMRFDDDPV